MSVVWELYFKTKLTPGKTSFIFYIYAQILGCNSIINALSTKESTTNPEVCIIRLSIPWRSSATTLKAILSHVFQQPFFHQSTECVAWSYLGRRLALLVLPVLLAVGVLLVAGLVARAFDEGLVVVVGAGGTRQDAHEVTVVAQVLQQAGHPPGGRYKQRSAVNYQHCLDLKVLYFEHIQKSWLENLLFATLLSGGDSCSVCLNLSTILD